MAEEIFGFNKDGVRRTAETNRRVLGTLPPVGRRTRRIYTGNTTTGGGGGTGGAGCSCCDCTSCLNMCDQNATDVIQTCSECTTAPKTFTVNFGSVIGSQNFVYVSGCTWATANFTVTYTYPGPGGSDSGTYKGTFVQNGTDSTLNITYVSGTDCLKLGSGYRVLSWKGDPDKEWSCICNMTMIPAVPPHRFPPNLFAPCEACVAPVAATGLDAGDCPDYMDNRCFTVMEFSGIDNGGPTILENVTFEFEPDLPYCRFHSVLQPGGVGVFPQGAATVGLGGPPIAPRLGITVYITGTSDKSQAVYTSSATTNDTGPMTFDLVTTGADAAEWVGYTWPSTLTVELTDCTFGASNYDYGYGCGTSSTGCTGVCNVTSVSGTSPTNFVWTFTGAEASNCSSGCGCQSVDVYTNTFGYPTMAGLTAGLLCL